MVPTCHRGLNFRNHRAPLTQPLEQTEKGRLKRTNLGVMVRFVLVSCICCFYRISSIFARALENVRYAGTCESVNAQAYILTPSSYLPGMVVGLSAFMSLLLNHPLRSLKSIYRQSPHVLQQPEEASTHGEESSDHSHDATFSRKRNLHSLLRSPLLR